MKIEFSKKTIARFLITLILGLVVAFAIHSLILVGTSGGIGVVVYVSYGVQLVLGVASFFLLSRISQKRGEQVGYFFLGLSMLKFLVYIVGFRFYFMQDDVVSKGEYAIFFVPYIVAFAIEITYLVGVLNRVPIDQEKVIVYHDEEE
jgi:hypothetical protein